MTSDDYVISVISGNFFVHMMKYKEHQCLVLFFSQYFTVLEIALHFQCEERWFCALPRTSRVMKRTKNSGKKSQNITVKLHRICLPKLQ